MTWLPATPPLTAQDLSGGGRLVLHCWAEWNAYDRVLDERLQPLCREFRAQASFRSCDFNDPRFFPVLREWNVLNVPALVLVENGRMIEVKHGLLPDDSLKFLLARWLIEQPGR